MSEKLREAMKSLVRTAQLLQQNAEGCAVNHHGLDFQEQGLPGWLRDTQKSIDAAYAALAEPAAATISPHERCPAPDADPTSAPDTPFFECPGCGIDCANPSEQHKPSCPRGGRQMNLTDEQVMVGAKALMNTFIKKWFLGSYRGPVYLDCINGEMAWLDEARACLTAAFPRAHCGGGK